MVLSPGVEFMLIWIIGFSLLGSTVSVAGAALFLLFPGQARQVLVPYLISYRNVAICHADGYHGWPEFAPFDGIVVTAAAPVVPLSRTLRW